MSDQSRLIKERALAILRETRAKIDPALLNALKEHISSAMPQNMPKPAKVARAPKGEVKFVPPVFEETPEPLQESTHESVDKQKIAQIVLNYMKHRENGSRH